MNDVIAALARMRFAVRSALVHDVKVDPDLRGKPDAKPGDWSERGRRIFVAGALCGWEPRQIADNILSGRIHPGEMITPAVADHVWSRLPRHI